MNGKYIQFLIIIIIPILLISGPILYLSTDINFFNKEIDKSNVIDQSFTNKENAKSIAKNVVLYFKNKEDINPSLVGPTAAIHMEDVKTLRLLSLYFFYSLTVLIIMFILVLFLIKNQKRIPKSLFLGAMLTIGINILLFISITFIFNSFWTRLHEIIFTNNLWQLDPSQDTLVAVFSGKFFTDFLTRSIIISTIASTILMVAGIIMEFIKPINKTSSNLKSKERPLDQKDFQW